MGDMSNATSLKICHNLMYRRIRDTHFAPGPTRARSMLYNRTAGRVSSPPPALARTISTGSPHMDNAETAAI